MFYFLLILTISGCQWDTSSDNLPNDYVLSWVDLPTYRNIHKEGRGMLVKPHVFEVGFDNNYIIVKQNPLLGEFLDAKIDESTLNYFIVRMEHDNIQEMVWGPLTSYEFDSLCYVLNISEIDFSIIYEKEKNVRLD
ncbi:hypothetical protein KFE94_16790 [bacterium SCSIO 12643]|nr:hypothetical protein KFE94_16790 [bacterium SCSIO 12643]